MISALWSDGKFIIQIVRSTISQHKFQEFIWIINFILKSILKNEIDNAILTLDNASVHTSIRTRNLLSRLNIRASYLHPYSTKLAPVELCFNIIKSKLRSNSSTKIIDFWKDSGLKWKFEVLKEITEYQLMHLWKKTISEAKQWIVNIN